MASSLEINKKTLGKRLLAALKLIDQPVDLPALALYIEDVDKLEAALKPIEESLAVGIQLGLIEKSGDSFHLSSGESAEAGPKNRSDEKQEDRARRRDRKGRGRSRKRRQTRSRSRTPKRRRK